MTDNPFSLAFIETLIERSATPVGFEELADEQRPYRSLVNVDAPETSAGYLRLWAAPDDHPLLDRMLHFRLISQPVETQLFFLFGRADTAMPHFHAQVVQFPGDGCVYNADLIPRLDAVDHPRYFERVFAPLSKPYWRATKDRDNVCSNAPGNPAIAVYLSPWSIGTGSPATREELNRVSPQIDAYLAHYLALADAPEAFADFDVTPDALRDRDARHLALFFSDRLDRRAWQGVYRVIGEETGSEIKSIFQKPLK